MTITEFADKYNNGNYTIYEKFDALIELYRLILEKNRDELNYDAISQETGKTVEQIREEVDKAIEKSVPKESFRWDWEDKYSWKHAPEYTSYKTEWLSQIHPTINITTVLNVKGEGDKPYTLCGDGTHTISSNKIGFVPDEFRIELSYNYNVSLDIKYYPRPNRTTYRDLLQMISGSIPEKVENKPYSGYEAQVKDALEVQKIIDKLLSGKHKLDWYNLELNPNYQVFDLETGGKLSGIITDLDKEIDPLIFTRTGQTHPKILRLNMRSLITEIELIELDSVKLYEPRKIQGYGDYTYYDMNPQVIIEPTGKGEPKTMVVKLPDDLSYNENYQTLTFAQLVNFRVDDDPEVTAIIEDLLTHESGTKALIPEFKLSGQYAYES